MDSFVDDCDDVVISTSVVFDIGRVGFGVGSRIHALKKNENKDYNYSLNKPTILFSELFHFDAWYDHVLWFVIDIFNLFLKNYTGNKQIILRSEVHSCRNKITLEIKSSFNF